MQTRRDHIQAYQFATGRLVHALTAGDPGTGEQPMRRANLGVVLGLVFAVLLSGGAVVYGLISPAPDFSWRAQGSIIVDKDTGTRYVLLGGALRPAANYASARLAGSSKPVSMVAHKALAGTPVGPRIGIAGAPEGVPAPTALLNGAWALCLGPAGTGGTVTDLAPAGRTDPAPHRPILVTAVAAASKTALGTAGISGEYVLWDAKKYPVPNASVLAALGLGDQVPLPADAAWLGVLATGDPIGPAAVPGAGSRGPAIAGAQATVGQLFQTTAAGVAQFYVLRTDGLAPITRTEAALFATAPGSRPPVQVGPADIAAAPASPDQSLLRRLPDMVSTTPYTPDGSRLCVLESASAANTATLAEAQVLAKAQSQSALGAGSGDAAKAALATALANATQPQVTLVTEADRLLPANTPVVVPAGTGLLALSSSVVPQTGAPYSFLITDTGERFELAGSDALGALGYTGAAGHVIPDSILTLLPPGPTLSVAAAREELPWSAG